MNLRQALFGGFSRVPRSDNPSLYPIQIATKSGESLDLSCYRGKVVLIVNTASKCGFTKQYDDLEALYKRFGNEGLVVLGFPSNDFLSQEPGSDADIDSFCRINFGVTFQLFPKASVRGPEKQPLFVALTTKGPSDLRGEVRWNFEKFLIDREGRLVGRWRSWVRPSWRIFQGAVQKALRG